MMRRVGFFFLFLPTLRGGGKGIMLLFVLVNLTVLSGKVDRETSQDFSFESVCS